MGMLITPEYRDFLNLETIQRKAGSGNIAAIAAKEITDNALDIVGHCRLGEIGENGFYVEDDGPGIDIELLPILFSVNRDLYSSKKWRLPTRGALGNGLRVVVGSVYATDGRLIVSTRGKRFDMAIKDDGTTNANYIGEYAGIGTRVEIHFGSGLSVDLSLAKMAVEYAEGKNFKGKTSAHWYSSESFFELLKASSSSVREIVAQFDGCTGTKAGMISAPFKGKQANSLAFIESEVLLDSIKQTSENVNPKRLGSVGECEGVGYYAGEGTFITESVKGRHDAEIPFVVEVWAELSDRSGIQTMVNKSPITGELHLWGFNKKTLTLSGCGLSHEFDAKTAKVTINVITPYMPITSDGKEPNLHLMRDVIIDTIQRAIKKSSRFKPREIAASSTRISEKDIIKNCIHEAIDKASGSGEYRYSQRQLFYAVRPHIINLLNKEPDYNYFSSVITEIESTDGDLLGLYRDPRGVLYHPHLRTEIPLGTLSVEEYSRPDWTFNKILYSEKEGFFPILKDTKWAEKHDCALMTSKGFASRAVKDIIDLLGDTDEELLFFCIHDSDAAGTMIFESLQEATKARPERRVRIINLGLDPWEAVEMALEIERVESKGKRAVASYIPVEWATWLQKNRVELNAMPTPLFLKWLDQKMELHGAGKLIPPSDVMVDRLKSDVKRNIRDEITERVLSEAGIDQLTDDAYNNLLPEISDRSEDIKESVEAALHERPEHHWTAPIKTLSERISHNDIN
jgi:hypothetical protein